MSDAQVPLPNPDRCLGRGAQAKDGRCPNGGQSVPISEPMPAPEPVLAPVPKTWPLRYLGLLAALSLATRVLLMRFAGVTVSGNLLPLSVLFACALLASGFVFLLIGSLKKGRDTRLLLRMALLNMGLFVAAALLTVLHAALA